MTTLVINAPKAKAEQEGKRSFVDTLASGVGDGYAIWRSLFAQLSPGCRVVLLCKDAEKRAEGRLVKLEPNGKTDSGVQRYDVYMASLREVEYKSERLNRNGVAIINN
jgi:hypothetical protein